MPKLTRISEEENNDYVESKNRILTYYNGSEWENSLLLISKIVDNILIQENLELVIFCNGLWDGGRFSFEELKGISKYSGVYDFLQGVIEFDDDLDPSEKNPDGLVMNMCIINTTNGIKKVSSFCITDGSIENHKPEYLKEACIDNISILQENPENNEDILFLTVNYMLSELNIQI